MVHKWALWLDLLQLDTELVRELAQGLVQEWERELVEELVHKWAFLMNLLQSDIELVRELVQQLVRELVRKLVWKLAQELDCRMDQDQE